MTRSVLAALLVGTFAILAFAHVYWAAGGALGAEAAVPLCLLIGIAALVVGRACPGRRRTPVSASR